MPAYFQTVQQVSATTSGVLVLPLGVGLIVSVPLAGFLTSYVGYPNPFMILNGLATPIATGLLTTVKRRPATCQLLVYQTLLGFGTGIGFQGPQIAVQAVLSNKDSQIGIAIIQLAQALGPAVFVAAAQTVLTSNLSSAYTNSTVSREDTEMSSSRPMPSAMVEGSGVSADIYSEALSKTFYVSLGLACAAFVGSLGIEWHSVKRKGSTRGAS